MYFSGKLEIDPTQMTLIKRVKPTKLFGKLLDALSFGQLSDKQEHETFTALTILQQLNMGLRSLDIKNVIRLAVDDYDFYLDERGLDDDLSQAMFELKAKIDPLESEIFKTVYLVLEHLDDTFKYVIEISVERKHLVGDYPIKINVNGVLADYRLKEGETIDQLSERMNTVFADQNKYNDFANINRKKFDHFLDKLQLSIRKVIKVDDIKVITNTNIIRPRKLIKDHSQIRHDHHTQPLYFGYYGLDNYIMYSWLWSGALYNHNLYVNNYNLVDETGHEIMSVGENGFNAGDFNTLNPEADFEAPTEGDVRYLGDNDYSDQLQDANLLGSEDLAAGDSSEGSDWLGVDAGDSFDIGDSGDISSCSSCSSCGGCSD
ncbi:hypothetical protein LDC_1371 [sediment metagenome]|uniref:Uncharacterized protein n=1 Tax=sediment metagenome TaxID=749907 RepID=D9PIL3_9ZZZZ